MLEIGALFIILAVLGLGAMFLGITISVVQHLIAGLVVGALARLFIPGRENVGLLGTALFGIAGGLLGGFVGQMFGAGSVVELVLSIGCAAALLTASGRTQRRVA